MPSVSLPPKENALFKRILRATRFVGRWGRWLSKEEVEKDEGFEAFLKFNLQLTLVEVWQSIFLGGDRHTDERSCSGI